MVETKQKTIQNNQEPELIEKKTYRIPIAWKASKEYKIEASSLAEAAILGVNQFLSEHHENYLNDSHVVEKTIKELNPNDTLDFDKLCADIINSI